MSTESNILALILFLILMTGTAEAVVKNLGTAGTTYPVIEPNIVDELRRDGAARNAEIHAELEKLRKTYQPKDIHHLPRAERDRTFLVDMTYTLPKAIKDGEGNVIYPAGFTFNPLDYVPFTRALMVLNGKDQAQLKWFQQTPYADNYRVMLLLSDGYADNVSKQLKRPVFFLTDKIAKRLHLAAVPSLVMQKDDKMQVKEFYVPENK